MSTPIEDEPIYEDEKLLRHSSNSTSKETSAIAIRTNDDTGSDLERDMEDLDLSEIREGTTFLNSMDNERVDGDEQIFMGSGKTRPSTPVPFNLIFYMILIILCLGVVTVGAGLFSRVLALAIPSSLQTTSLHKSSSAIDGIATLLEVEEEEELPCGTTPNEARDRGCDFDPLTFAWLPPRCYDYELTAEFLRLQNWSWWRVREQESSPASPALPKSDLASVSSTSRRQLSLINVMQGSDMILHVTWEYHVQHCAYLWLKMHRAMLRRGAIDGVSMMGIITDVCDGVFRSRRSLNDTSVPGYIRFPSCKFY